MKGRCSWLTRLLLQAKVFLHHCATTKHHSHPGGRDLVCQGGPEYSSGQPTGITANAAQVRCLIPALLRGFYVSATL